MTYFSSLIYLVFLFLISGCLSGGETETESEDPGGVITEELGRCKTPKSSIILSAQFNVNEDRTELRSIQASGRVKPNMYSIKGNATNIEDSHRKKVIKRKGKKHQVKIHSYRVTLDNDAELLGTFGDLKVKNLVLNIIEYSPKFRKGNIRINYTPRKKAPKDWNFFISCRFPGNIQLLTDAAEAARNPVEEEEEETNDVEDVEDVEDAEEEESGEEDEESEEDETGDEEESEEADESDSEEEETDEEAADE